jgi:NAD(P)-dependent dehydrogenase (short-subunit alcohol dehydrogenase family)
MNKNIINSISQILRKISLMVKSMKKIYRTGGYATYSITSIQPGRILEGKKVLITGGGSGIGLAIARKCLSEGAQVLITGRDEKKLLSVSDQIDHPLLMTLAWDVSKIDKLEDTCSKAFELLGGGIDILVNNAGIMSGIQFPHVTEEMWDKIYSINSKGLFFLTQHLCQIWLDEGSNLVKKVLNISSQGGFVGATYPYRLTKWDVAGLTQGLGIKLAPSGIIVNGIAPGIVATQMQPECLKQNENMYSPHNPLERFALPVEIAELALFLMSDASNFIVGQTIVCDGGYSLK